MSCACLCQHLSTCGKGGGPINIFTTGGGYGRGRAPPVTARGALLAPPVGSGALPQKLFAFAFI